MLADALERDVDEISGAIASAIADQVLGLAEDPETTDDVRRRSRPMLLEYAASFRSGTPPESIEIPSQYLGFVRALARRAVPLSVALRVNGLGLRILLAACVERLGKCGLSADDLLLATRELVRHAFAFHEAQNLRLGDEYRAAREIWIHSAEAVRRTTVDGVLADKPVDLDSVARALGYDLRRHHLALVLWARADQNGVSVLPQLERTATEIADRLGSTKPLTLAAGAGMLWTWIGSERQFVHDASSVAASVCASQLWAAVGEPAFGLRGFRQSHSEATLAARVARLGDKPAGTITRFRDVGLAAAVVHDLVRARRFVQEELALLSADDEESERLRATLRISREENGSRIATACRLGVHPNTVSNRLRVCWDLLDQSPVSGQLELDIALKLAALLGSSVLRQPS